MARRYRSVSRDQDRPIVPAPTGSNYYFTIVYNKGAWVLHTLRWVLGDAVFFAALDHYALCGQDSSVTVAGFRGAVEDISGLSLGWFFDEWLYRIGYPKYRLDWSVTPAGDSFRLVTRLAQANGAGAPYVFRTPVPVFADGTSADTTVTIEPLANPQVDTFTVAERPVRLIVDPDDWILDSSYVTTVAVAEQTRPTANGSRLTASLVRGVLTLPQSRAPRPAPLLVNAVGRSVLALKPGLNDVSRFAPGVYFVMTRGSRGQGFEGSSVRIVIAK